MNEKVQNVFLCVMAVGMVLFAFYFLVQAGRFTDGTEKTQWLASPEKIRTDKPGKTVKKTRRLKVFKAAAGTRRRGNARALRPRSGNAAVFGRVLAAGTKEPLGNARIRLYWHMDTWDPDYAEFLTSTRKSGTFRLRGLARNMSAIVQIQAPGFAVVQKNIRIPGSPAQAGKEKPATNLGDILLEKGVHVVFKAIDADSGRSLPKALFTIYRMKNRGSTRAAAVSTGSEGTVSINLLKGTYKLWVEACGYEPTEKKALDVKSTSGLEPIEVRLRKGAPIAGKVVDDEDAPIKGARVSVNCNGGTHGLQTRSGPGGEFELPGCIHDKTYTLSAGAEGYRGTSIGDTTSGTTGITLKLKAILTVTGCVTDAKTGEPVEKAYVYLGGKCSYSTYTNDKGVYKISRETGKLNMRVRHTGYKDITDHEVEIPKGSPASITADFKLERGIALYGVVKAEDTGKPLKNVSVGVMFPVRGRYETKVSLKTKADGTFAAGGLGRTGTARVTFGHSDYLYHVEEMEIKKQGSTLEAALKPGVRIRGLVTDSSGVPIKGVYINVDCSKSINPIIQSKYGSRYYRTHSTRTGRDGTYLIKNIRPLKVLTVSASHGKHLGFKQDVSLEGCETLCVDFALSSGGEISGRITEQDGGFVKGVYVNANMIDAGKAKSLDTGYGNEVPNTSGNARSDDDGYYRIVKLHGRGGL
jgi:hypothetical protein